MGGHAPSENDRVFHTFSWHRWLREDQRRRFEWQEISPTRDRADVRPFSTFNDQGSSWPMVQVYSCGGVKNRRGDYVGSGPWCLWGNRYDWPRPHRSAGARTYRRYQRAVAQAGRQQEYDRLVKGCNSVRSALRPDRVEKVRNGKTCLVPARQIYRRDRTPWRYWLEDQEETAQEIQRRLDDERLARLSDEWWYGEDHEKESELTDDDWDWRRRDWEEEEEQLARTRSWDELDDRGQWDDECSACEEPNDWNEDGWMGGDDWDEDLPEFEFDLGAWLAGASGEEDPETAARPRSAEAAEFQAWMKQKASRGTR